MVSVRCVKGALVLASVLVCLAVVLIGPVSLAVGSIQYDDLKNAADKESLDAFCEASSEWTSAVSSFWEALLPFFSVDAAPLGAKYIYTSADFSVELMQTIYRAAGAVPTEEYFAAPLGLFADADAVFRGAAAEAAPKAAFTVALTYPSAAASTAVAAATARVCRHTFADLSCAAGTGDCLTICQGMGGTLCDAAAACDVAQRLAAVEFVASFGADGMTVRDFQLVSDAYPDYLFYETVDADDVAAEAAGDDCRYTFSDGASALDITLRHELSPYVLLERSLGSLGQVSDYARQTAIFLIVVGVLGSLTFLTAFWVTPTFLKAQFRHLFSHIRRLLRADYNVEPQPAAE